MAEALTSFENPQVIFIDNELALNSSADEGGHVTNDKPRLQPGSATNAATNENASEWEQFCENYAKSVALDFAQSWYNFLAERPALLSSVSEHELSNVFVKTFVSHFESETRRICHWSRALNESVGASTSTEALHVDAATARSSPESDSDFSDGDKSRAGAKKPFLKRFSSLKEMRKTLFSMSSSNRGEETRAITPGRCSAREPSVERSRNQQRFLKKYKLKKEKSKTAPTAKTVVEVVREGTANYLSGKELDGTRWEKCRLCLVKTVGGYMLEFYAPPKSSKPKSGIFCFLITEVRETTELETPDHENTFVLKAENLMEYVVQTKSAEDLQAWLTAVRHSTSALPLPPKDRFP